MTPAQRDRLAGPVVVIYWLMLLGGLGMYTAIRVGEGASLVSMWIGVIAGTALGQILALRNIRLWVVASTLLLLVFWGVPLTPSGSGGSHLWMAFVPAVLCGFWSLTDRCSLLAFWFPAMVWMLSILDRTDRSSVPDGAGLMLLGVLAALFIMFLRVRESRRVGMWSTVAVAPLAEIKPSTLLRQVPGSQVARAGWGLLVSAVSFAVTAWVAPQLWHHENLDHHVQVAHHDPSEGVPCCQPVDDVELDGSRVKEYFDIGRSHDEIAIEQRPGIDCQVCSGADVAMGYGYGDGDGEVDVLHDTAIPDGTGATGHVDSVPPPGRYQAPSWTPPANYGLPAVNYGIPMPSAPSVTLPSPHIVTPAPITPSVAPPPPIAPSVVVEPSTPPPPPPPRLDPPPAAAIAPSAPAPSSAQRAPVSVDRDPALLHWILVLIASAVVFQFVSLALRPLRRLILLRHLRNPFWDETVDQRVSNSWQLALVGLRDAGWRSSSSEAPREFAQRVGVDGIDRCATILERARHGIGIDAEDLSEMSAAADVAYHSARGRIGAFARMVGWIRWPLA